MIQPRIVEYKSSEYEEMLALRTKVLREPLGLTFTEEDLEKENADIFLALYLSETERIVACCILTPLDDKIVKLRQMAVDNSSQNLGFGTGMLSFAEYIAGRKGFEKIILHARKHAVRFYQKYDYMIIGEEFMEVGIPHLEMEKQIAKI